MIFDLFHSVSDPVVDGRSLGAKKCAENFLSQTLLAEQLGFDTIWMAESHFSSETQKKTSVATIPSFHGEVGLNSDSFQWFHVLHSKTKKLNFGTGIHNIVGGSGGPIASADRVNTLRFINENIWSSPRLLRVGIASGRFPYQNTVFGVTPRDNDEKKFWPLLKRYQFLEALEIFLRLLNGEELSSESVSRYQIEAADAEKSHVRHERFPVPVSPRWIFEKTQLVPAGVSSERLRLVLGSSDPLALEVGRRFWDMDLFNLSFTPPAEIEKMHQKLFDWARSNQQTWHRSRLPRTVLVFIDPEPKRAQALASRVLDSYIAAMQGTAQVPDKTILLERALVGDAAQIREQVQARYHAEDRLMLWFEFNQLENAAIESRMRYFAEEVIAKL